MPEYQKAFIGPYINGHMELKDGFYVPFNPAEISIEEAVGISDEIQADSGRRAGWMQKGHTTGIHHPPRNSLAGLRRGMTTLSTTLFFNTLNDLYQVTYEDVRDEIRKLYPYTNTMESYTSNMITSNSKAGLRQVKIQKAQQIYFFWGTIAVAGMLKQMGVHYTMFAPDGKPVRAQVSISIEGFYVGEATATKLPAAGKTGSGANVLADDLSDWKTDYRGCPNPRMLL